MKPILVVFCGPNGAGKSTLRRITLGDDPLPFVNADDLGRYFFGAGHAAAKSYEAALVAESVRGVFLERGISFSFETVLSDPHGEKVKALAAARDAGFHLVVHFVGLESAALSRARVIQRVEEGGHDVPDDKIASRFRRVIANLCALLGIPDELTIYDNSSEEVPYRVVARLEQGSVSFLSADLPDWAGSLGLSDRPRVG